MIAAKPTFMQRSLTFIASHKFFMLILAFFLLQAAWIALTAKFPLLFDERYHIGLIDLYSHQWSPLITGQGPETAVLGDTTRYGSYLYHYLMSFPYRIVQSLSGDSVLALIIVRLFSVGFVVASLVYFRRTLLLLGIGRAVTNSTILLFTLVPLVSFIAAHVSYDTLQLLGSAIFMYYLVRFIKHSGNTFVDASLLLSAGLLTSLVKFSFLPIFLIGVFGAFVWVLYKRKQVVPAWRQGFVSLATPARVGIILLLVVGGGLFIERFGGNALQYHSFEAPCEKVRSLEQCMRYAPWHRNYELEKQQDEHPVPLKNRLAYTKDFWLPGMVNHWLVAGRVYDEQTGESSVSQGMPVLRIAVWVFLVFGLGALLLVGWRLFNNPASLLLLAITLGYFGILWIRNYGEYVEFASPVAVQARYGLPLVVFFMAFSLQALSIVLRSQRLKLGVLIVSLLVSSQGGGIVSYLILQRPEAHLPASPLIQIDTKIRSVLKKVVKEKLFRL